MSPSEATIVTPTALPRVPSETKTFSGKPPADDPYFYGFRQCNQMMPDGTVISSTVPLTLEDVLHPQEDDVIPGNPLHDEANDLLRFVTKFRTTGHDLTLHDCRIDWGVPGVEPHAPDHAVFLGVSYPLGDWGTFHCAQHRHAKADLVVEVTSPGTRINDVDPKVADYERVGVKQYVIVDYYADPVPEVVSYEMTKRGFVRGTPDSNGRILLRCLDVALAFEAGALRAYDATTGQVLLPPVAAVRERDAVIKSKDAELQFKDAALESRDAVIKSKDAELESAAFRERQLQELVAKLQAKLGESSAARDSR